MGAIKTSQLYQIFNLQLKKMIFFFLIGNLILITEKILIMPH